MTFKRVLPEQNNKEVDFMKHFVTSMDPGNSNSKIFKLKQKSNQTIQEFVDDLERTYESVYGPKLDSTNHTKSSIREILLLENFFNGILREVQDILISENLLLTYTWPIATKAALRAERRLIFRKLTATPINDALRGLHSPLGDHFQTDTTSNFVVRGSIGNLKMDE